MRTFLVALAAIVPALCVIDLAKAADQPPAFDIARNCKEETVGGVGFSVEACTKDETDAKDQLTKSWSSFGASQKKACVEESSVGGGQSYVELLTCLEMSAGGHFSPKQ